MKFVIEYEQDRADCIDCIEANSGGECLQKFQALPHVVRYHAYNVTIETLDQWFSRKSGPSGSKGCGVAPS